MEDESSTAFEGFSALRTSVRLAAIIAWCASCLTAVHLNGGEGLLRDHRAMVITTFSCLTTALLSIAVLTVRPFRLAVTAPDRRHLYHPAPFALLAFVTGVLGALAIHYRVHVFG